MQNNAVCTLDLPIRAGVRNVGPVNSDVVVVVKPEECRVRDSEAVEDVEEELHSLHGFDRRGRPSFDPLRELVYGDK